MKVPSAALKILLLASSCYNVMPKEDIVHGRGVRIGEQESSTHLKLGRKSRKTIEEGSGGCPRMNDCPGRTYIRGYNFNETSWTLAMDFDQALMAMWGCVLAPASEVRAQLGYLYATYGPLTGLAWVGAYKDPALLYDGDEPIGEGERIEGWTNVDHTDWFTTPKEADKAWKKNEPAAGNGAVAISEGGKLVALKVTDLVENGYYKCCQDYCQDYY